MAYFIAINSTLGPYRTLAEAEFAAREALKNAQFQKVELQARPDARQAQILELVRTVDPEPTLYTIGGKKSVP